MIRRPLWLAGGAALGVAGTLWAEQRVRRQLRRAADLLTPQGAASGAVRSARRARDRLREAVDAGRIERSRYETEMRRMLAGAPAGAAPGRLRPLPGAPVSSPEWTPTSYGRRSPAISRRAATRWSPPPA